jgi:hypothetical protein
MGKDGAKKVVPAAVASGIHDFIILACPSGHWFAGPHGVTSRRTAHKESFLHDFHELHR